MDEGVAVVVAVAALLAVYFLSKKQEQRTAVMVANIQRTKANAGLTAGDSVRIYGTVAATVVGGPKAGQAVLGLTGGLS